jgi:hypothetical protein
VGPGSLVFDCFSGTGSVLVSAADLAPGIVVLGADIDPRVMCGKQGRTVASNFRAYGLGASLPELALMSASRLWVPALALGVAGGGDGVSRGWEWGCCHLGGYENVWVGGKGA